MEFLQGRALNNAIGNLNIQGAYADALSKLGHELEEIVEQEKDAALGNGGLGRLASCFLDSMATLNLPAWGYGLRYRYGLFKQRITKEGQEEIAEDWLEKFSPWEVVRHGVVFPVRFFGRVQPKVGWWRDCASSAYDVPIPGYKTKNTISLRLWEARASAEDFNLFQFNDGQYESAAQLHTRAQQICAVLYPGDATEEEKLLRLKQQFFVCSASLQDHCLYKSQVLPEALEKWSQTVMWKLLPRHMEIIEEIDKRVNGVAQLHSDILKSELFADCVSVWPKKFQNKTNGITPRRWLRFCSPELSNIITKWLKTDQWVTKLDLLVGLRKVDNADFQTEWASAKMANKQPLARYILQVTGVVFVPNYNVSVAEMLIPGSELSQHISTAGMEASGTSSMKFALNGCLIVGTLDGANVEIREEIGDENFFLFGATADDVLGYARIERMDCDYDELIGKWSSHKTSPNSKLLTRARDSY
ncbi:hypothetical protein GH714_035203 [Hevea brasiliensis]|uniref:Alpha-1,4 glucan phosphorylase n=1 Tax=Hevea brasiliensis TaxID=3981 RepID=A0A6A6MJA6_HEVBR|nr:hypothetical protein GH714_035203 [Hevea brasiliensis]